MSIELNASKLSSVIDVKSSTLVKKTKTQLVTQQPVVESSLVSIDEISKKEDGSGGERTHRSKTVISSPNPKKKP